MQRPITSLFVQSVGEHCHILAKGKWALSLVLDRLLENSAIQKGCLLVPEYFCELSLSPIRRGGHRVRFYRLDDRLGPDVGHIEHLAHRHGPPTAVLVVHYFGLPSPWAELETWCRHNGVCPIEDAAHSLLPVPGIGGRGFPTIFTPWKMMGIGEGAILVSQPPGETICLPSNGRDDSNGWQAIRSFGWRTLSNLAMWGGFPLHRLRPYVAKGPEESEPWQNPNRPHCGRLSLRMWQNMNCRHLQNAAARREAHYRRLDRHMRDAGHGHVRLPVPLPAMMAPYVYPIRLPAALAWKILVALNRLGIPAAPWSDLSPEVNGSIRYPLANALRREIVTLPIHQAMANRHIDRMGNVVTKLLDSP